MGRTITTGLAALGMLVAPQLSTAQPAPVSPVDAAAEAAGYRQALNAATRDLCGKDVAVLGENGFHGDGQTVAFKAALIERLVTRCGFKAVYFEASHYDFLAIDRGQRAGRPVTREQVSSAIGWIWNHDAELQPLIGFLAEQASARRIRLGGLDDQLGARDAFYSLEQMPSELTARLPASQREDCQARLHQRLFFAYSQATPHTVQDLVPLRACLAGIKTAIEAQTDADAASREEGLQMLANIERCIARDFVGREESVQARDRSMALNLSWLATRQAPRGKIIVWAATVHVAKHGPAGVPTLGTAVEQAWGRRAFVLGFSAASGAYRYSSKKSVPIAAAPDGSMEARALAGTGGGAAYRGSAWLAKLGPVAGAPFDHTYATGDWSKLIDGVVVFRAERPPRRTDG